jgi:hypothetical protein
MTHTCMPGLHGSALTYAGYLAVDDGHPREIGYLWRGREARASFPGKTQKSCICCCAPGVSPAATCGLTPADLNSDAEFRSVRGEMERSRVDGRVRRERMW